MEGGLPSTQTVLGMVAAGLTIALVDPAIKQRALPGVIFRPISDRGLFIESGVIYRREDRSPLLASFLHEVRLTPRARAESRTVDETAKRAASKTPGVRVKARGRRTVTATV